jgi:ATP-dependent Clp protease ATP-binding subunit ClpX
LGRLPVIATLDELDEESLVNILTKPKNALVKQYQKLFEIEGVNLEFDNEALHMISQDAIKRKTGARGLRSILENILLDTMYDLPSLKNCRSCRITGDVLRKKEKPILEFGTDPDKEKEIA